MNVDQKYVMFFMMYIQELYNFVNKYDKNINSTNIIDYKDKITDALIDRIIEQKLEDQAKEMVALFLAGKPKSKQFKCETVMDQLSIELLINILVKEENYAELSVLNDYKEWIDKEEVFEELKAYMELKEREVI